MLINSGGRLFSQTFYNINNLNRIRCFIRIRATDMILVCELWLGLKSVIA